MENNVSLVEFMLLAIEVKFSCRRRLHDEDQLTVWSMMPTDFDDDDSLILSRIRD